MKRRALFFIYLQDRSLETVTQARTQKHSFSVQRGARRGRREMYAPAHWKQTKALWKGSLNSQFLSLRFTVLVDVEDFDISYVSGSLPIHQHAGYCWKINGSLG